MCLVETWCTSEPVFMLSSSIEYAQENIQPYVYSPAVRSEERGRAKGGINISYNSNLFQSRVLFTSRYYIFTLMTKGEFQFVLGSVYISPLENLESILINFKEDLNSIIQNFICYPIIIGGDFNCRIANDNFIIDENILYNSEILCERFSMDSVKNSRGKMLVECMEDLGFYVINGRANSDFPAKFTYVGGSGCSVIDLIWVNDMALSEIADLREYD